MVSDLAVPQFGQVIIDSKIIFDASRIHEAEDRRDRAERYDGHQESAVAFSASSSKAFFFVSLPHRLIANPSNP